MTTNEKIARRKLSLLELAKDLNVVVCHPGHRFRWYSRHPDLMCSMKKLHRSLTAEFKLEAASLVLD